MVPESSAVLSVTQRNLFGEPETPAAPPVAGLFAEVVFNRPLDHAYTYAVPDQLRGYLAVGKRVLASFGKAAFDQLRVATKPLPSKQLARQAGCGLGPIEALVAKGLARRIVQRVETFTDTTEAAELPHAALTLNPDQLRVWAPIEAALTQGG